MIGCMIKSSSISKRQKIYGPGWQQWRLCCIIRCSLFFWTGVYVLIDGNLIVRSYQGPVACQKLRNGGVCWAAINSGDTVIVDNVEEFPGHIACNAASKSEIVIPLRDPEGRIFGCLDVDSDQLGAFDREDEAGLKKILSLLYQSDSVK